MLQNKITPKRYSQILEDSKVKHSKHYSKQKRENLESKFHFLMDILELDISYCVEDMSDDTLKKLTHNLIKEISKYADLKNQMLRKYISNHVSTTVAISIKDKDLVKLCEVLSYTISEYNFRLY